jgi:hypothetical protein
MLRQKYNVYETKAGWGWYWQPGFAAGLASLSFGLFFHRRQSERRHGPGVFVYDEFETVGEQSAKHQLDRIGRC